MMRLNGWVKLWIVLSVGWLGLIGYRAYEDLSVLYRTKEYEAEIEGKWEVTFVFSAAQSDSDIHDQFNKNLL